MVQEPIGSDGFSGPDASIRSEESIRKVLAELQRRFRIAGRGTVSRVEQELDLGAGYFKDQRRPGRRRFDLKILFRALDALNIEPAEFFASVLGTADPVAAFQTEASVLRQRQKEPRVLVLETARALSRDVPEPAEEGEPEPDLEALDALRHDDPSAVLRRARILVGRICESRLPLLLGIHASASQAMGRDDEAQILLGRALELAEELRDQDQIGDLLLRAGYVTASRGEVETAHILAERASLMFAKTGNLIGLGRSLIEQGIWLGALDRPREAMRALSAALGYFPDDDGAEVEPDPLAQRNRFSCLTSLALICRGEGDLEAARRYLRQASRHTHGVGERQVGKMLVLRASIERQAGRPAEAESLFREAFELLQPADPLDAALCGVELAQVQLQQDKAPKAAETVKAMVPLLEPLEKNRAASAALTKLLRGALAGSPESGEGLTMPLLRRVAKDLEAGRKQTGGHAHPTLFSPIELRRSSDVQKP